MAVFGLTEVGAPCPVTLVAKLAVKVKPLERLSSSVNQKAIKNRPFPWGEKDRPTWIPPNRMLSGEELIPQRYPGVKRDDYATVASIRIEVAT